MSPGLGGIFFARRRTKSPDLLKLDSPDCDRFKSYLLQLRLLLSLYFGSELRDELQSKCG